MGGITLRVYNHPVPQVPIVIIRILSTISTCKVKAYWFGGQCSKLAQSGGDGGGDAQVSSYCEGILSPNSNKMNHLFALQ